MAAKEEIVTRIAQKSGMTKKVTYKFLEAFCEVLMDTLESGERFHLHKIFSMTPVEHKAHTKRNPRTQEKVEIPDRIEVKTTIGTKLIAAVNGYEDDSAEE